MNPYARILLVVFAVVFFAIAAIWNPPPANSAWFGRLVAAGLTALALAMLFGVPLP
jgi:hypothetical protein